MRRLRPALLGLVLLAGAMAAPQDSGDMAARRAALRAEMDRIQLELNALEQARRAPEELVDESSVMPGINDSWKSDNIRPLIQRLEAESREIFTQAETLAAVAGPRPGAEVADVGAGSGFMAQLFARMVGAEGRVYAVDINRSLMERLGAAAKQAGLQNLETVVCGEKDIGLPADSVDLVFVCDTYHHFEFPRNTLRSIHRALRPGGQLVIIDFHRIEGVSREFVLEHVRAGEEVFTAEILGAGFVLENRHDLPQLSENYCLRFRKP